MPPPAVPGLTSDQARALLAQHGPNDLAHAPRVGLLRQLVRGLFSPLMLILLAASAVAASVGEITDATIIFVTVLLGTALDAFQTSRSSAAVDRLRQSVIPTATVWRDGHVGRGAAARRRAGRRHSSRRPATWSRPTRGSSRAAICTCSRPRSPASRFRPRRRRRRARRIRRPPRPPAHRPQRARRRVPRHVDRERRRRRRSSRRPAPTRRSARSPRACATRRRRRSSSAGCGDSARCSREPSSFSCCSSCSSASRCTAIRWSRSCSRWRWRSAWFPSSCRWSRRSRSRPAPFAWRASASSSSISRRSATSAASTCCAATRPAR